MAYYWDLWDEFLEKKGNVPMCVHTKKLYFYVRTIIYAWSYFQSHNNKLNPEICCRENEKCPASLTVAHTNPNDSFIFMKACASLSVIEKNI